MKHLNKIFLSLTLICFSLSYSSIVYSQSNNESGKKITYKKARALQASTAKRMALVFEAYERLDDEGKEDPDMVTVRRVLTELRAEISELRSYDRSVVWYQWGFLYLQDEDVDSAIKAFLSVINEPEVTKSYRESGLLTLAQLSLSQEKYDEAIEYIMQWMSEVDKVTAQSWSFLGIAYFSKENYQKAIESMETAINIAETEAFKPKENWYSILAASIEELKDEIGEKNALLRQADIYEVLINLYPKKGYYLQLGRIFNQLGREKDYMITLKAAYAKDLLDKEGEYLALAQLLLLSENPYWAAQVLVSGQNKLVEQKNDETEEVKLVPVVKNSEKNLKILADAWRMAQEIDKAIPILEQVSKMSKDGKSYVLLGNLYLQEDKITQAIDAIEKGIKKGGLTNTSQVYMALGQAHFENQSFEDAKKQFRVAARSKDEKIKKAANNWLRYTENEEVRIKNLALRRDFIQNS